MGKFALLKFHNLVAKNPMLNACFKTGIALSLMFFIFGFLSPPIIVKFWKYFFFFELVILSLGAIFCACICDAGSLPPKSSESADQSQNPSNNTGLLACLSVYLLANIFALVFCIFLYKIGLFGIKTKTFIVLTLLLYFLFKTAIATKLAFHGAVDAAKKN